MPPKKKSKAAVAKATKVVVDKTFGLKNKNKSKKVQDKIRMMEQSATGSSAQAQRKQKEDQAKAKELKKKQKDAARKAAFMEKQQLLLMEKKAQESGVVKVCPFFVKGKCPRGDQCLLSHDWGATRKVKKLDLYTDRRDGTDAEATTEITCKHFIEAIELKKYGEFWKCPNRGDGCQYRHKLPQGVIILSEEDRKNQEDSQLKLIVPVEEQIEIAREALMLSGGNLTPVTPETFAVWKEARRKRKELESKEEIVHVAKKGGKGVRALSGKALFQYDPTLFVDDESATVKADVASRVDKPLDDIVQVLDESLFLDADPIDGGAEE